jgi:hypothetical protein
MSPEWRYNKTPVYEPRKDRKEGATVGRIDEFLGAIQRYVNNFLWKNDGCDEVLEMFYSQDQRLNQLEVRSFGWCEPTIGSVLYEILSERKRDRPVLNDIGHMLAERTQRLEKHTGLADRDSES